MAITTSVAAICASLLIWRAEASRAIAIPLISLFLALSLVGPWTEYGIQTGLALWTGSVGLGGLMSAWILSRETPQRRGLFVASVLIGVIGGGRSAMELILV